jgi:hypothetical protein
MAEGESEIAGATLEVALVVIEVGGFLRQVANPQTTRKKKAA